MLIFYCVLYLFLSRFIYKINDKTNAVKILNILTILNIISVTITLFFSAWKGWHPTTFWLLALSLNLNIINYILFRNLRTCKAFSEASLLLKPLRDNTLFLKTIVYCGLFASYPAHKYAFEYGRLCAVATLSRNDFRTYKEISHIKKAKEDNVNQAPFVPALKTKQLKKKIIKLLTDQDFYNNIDAYAQSVSYSIAQQGLDRLYNTFYIQPAHNTTNFRCWWRSIY